jgi:TonB family protein
VRTVSAAAVVASGIVLTGTAVSGQPGGLPVEPVQQGVELYWAGQYQRTIELLDPLCAVESREDASTECYKYLAFSHVALGEAEMAQQAFSRLLARDAEYRLDESLVSPKILEQFEISRREIIAELFDKGKNAYFAKDYARATELLTQVLRLDAEQSLALEYSQLAREQAALGEKQASLAKQMETAARPPVAPVEEPEDHIYHVTSRITPPVLLERVQPDYPPGERRAGREGTVVLTAVIDKDGQLRDPKVIRPVSPVLDASAIQAVLRWRYQPARLGDRDVAVYTVVRLAFTLKP